MANNQGSSNGSGGSNNGTVLTVVIVALIALLVVGWVVLHSHGGHAAAPASRSSVAVWARGVAVS